jgi:hypothetical protein
MNQEKYRHGRSSGHHLASGDGCAGQAAHGMPVGVGVPSYGHNDFYTSPEYKHTTQSNSTSRR